MKNLTKEPSRRLIRWEESIRHDGVTVPIQAVRPQLTPHDKANMERLNVVIGPGLVESSNVLGGFATWLALAGLRQDALVTAHTYQVPMRGKRSYDIGFKVDLFAAAVEHVSRRRQAPVDVIAHSQGWDIALRAAQSKTQGGYGLAEDGYLNTLVGVAPAYHCVMGEPSVANVYRKIGKIIGEMASRAATTDIGKLSTLAACTRNAISHYVGSPVDATREAMRLMQEGCGERASEVARLMPLGVALCADDELTPLRPTFQNLRETDFPGLVVFLETDHMGPILDRRKGWADEALDMTLGLRNGRTTSYVVPVSMAA